MREQFWKLYLSFKHMACYYKYFLILFNRINLFISCICTAVSLSCVAAWGLWSTFPILWSVLICATQIFQALFPKMPYNDLLVSTKFMIPEINALLLSIRYDWLSIELDKYTDDQILSLIKNYEKQYSDLISKYFSASFLPDIGWCTKKAEAECRNYFSTTYSTEEE